MKKALTIAVSLLLTFVFLAAPVCAANLNPEELGEYGQKVHDINYITTKPKLDGKIADGEYGDPIYTMTQDSTDNCQYWGGSITDVVALSQYLPTKLVLYFSYDKNALYVAAAVTDEVHCVKDPGPNGWNGDAFEVDISLDFNGTTTGMLNRYRIGYNISKDGIPFGTVYNAPTGYGTMTTGMTMNEGYDYAISRDEETKLTIYETAFYWSDLSGSNEVPTKLFANIQLHVAHPDQSNGDYMGYWRYAVKLPSGADEKAGWALHLYNIDTSVFATETQAPVTTEAPKTDAPATTEAPKTDAPATDAPATDAPATNAPSTSAPSTQKPADTEKGNSTPIIIGVVAAVIVIAVVVFFVIKKRK